MSNTKMVALLMIASVASTAVTVSAQEIPRLEQREVVVRPLANRAAQGTFVELAESSYPAASTLPNAPVPAIEPIAFHPLASAVAQQQRNSNSPASYPNSNRRKYILLGVICAAAIVGGIVIATQRN